LIGDLGATHTRLALVRGDERICQKNYSTQTATSLEAVIQEFLNQEAGDLTQYGGLKGACFGVAGHVSQGEAYLTNVGWAVNESKLQALLGAPTLLVNDFYAQAVAMPLLKQESLTHICGPKNLIPEQGRSFAVLGAGSGLGEAILVSPQSDAITARQQASTKIASHEWLVVPTEGGHCRFAPRNDEEVKLNRWLQERYGEHISVERLVSGAGLVDLFYYFLGDQDLPIGFSEPVKGAQITMAAFERDCQISLKSLKHFVGIYADEAANLTLKSNAGVVFLSGGVTPHLLPIIHKEFPAHYVKKGRYQSLLANVSVWAVTKTDPGLFGAQALAERLIQSF
jgi:glucokinase